MARVVWENLALADLDNIAEYIAAHSVRAAIRVTEYIREAALNLEHSPRLGRQSVDPGLRELILSKYPYIVVYDVAEEDRVRVLSVIHQSRDRPNR